MDGEVDQTIVALASFGQHTNAIWHCMRSLRSFGFGAGCLAVIRVTLGVPECS
jgi:hypothetical protein